jgi:hypothetical protein
MLIDFFTGSPFEVETEKDLSIKQQLLDVVILRKRKGRFSGRLPDGLDNLTTHNLITFKSHHEALDDWALKELTGHYVNYRKQLQGAAEPLLPEAEFRMYAVCSRYPHNLANEVPWQQLQEGVYECRRGTDVIRVVVAGQLPKAEHNSLLHLFSASVDRLDYGARHYHKHAENTSGVINQLFAGYTQEGLTMGYTMADFVRWYTKKHLKELTPEERLEGLPPEELRKHLSPEERLVGLTPEEIRQYLEQLEQAAPAERKPRTGRRKRTR